MQPWEELIYSSMTEQLTIPFDAKCPKCPLVGYLQNTDLQAQQVNLNLNLSI